MSLVVFEKAHQGKLISLRLNRADKLNALSAQMMSDFEEAISRCEAEKVLQLVVLRSESDRAFCAGADLKERLDMKEEEVLATLDRQSAIMNRIAGLPVPVVALINGVAFGGGFELALACDVRIAGPRAKLGLTELQLAVIPGAGGTQRLSRLIGVGATMDMISFSRVVEAEEAARMGIVECFSDTPEVALQERIDKALSAGPLALRAAKKAIVEGQSLALNLALAHERRCYETIVKTEDRIEALRAFSEKRKANFRAK